MSIVYGDMQEFWATPEPGCKVGFWSLDGQIVQTNGDTFWLYDVATNHTLQVTFIAPLLSVALTATNTVVVAWPFWDGNWTLQTTTSLSDESTAWTDIPASYAADGDNYTFIEAAPAGKRFYRLQHP